MNLSEPFIKRPVATTLFAVGIALFGALAFKLLPVAPLPEVDFPTISVQATLPGADPNTVATSVATPLERQFGQISGVTQMTSVSSLGATRITMQFDLNRDINGAARDVQAAISAARTNLPANLDGNPTYRKVNPADAPILIVSLTSDSATRGQLYDAASTVLQQKLLQTPGVGDVTVGGGALPAVRIELNPDRVNHYGISLEQIRSAIATANVDLPKGSAGVGPLKYNIGANDQLYNAQDYAPLIVKQTGNDVVHISDLGYVRQDVENLENYGLSNGKPAVLLIVYKQPGANVIDTVNNVKAALPFLEASILPTIKLNILMDRTSTIRASLLDVEITLAISVLLVTAVTFAFFRNWRTTLVPAIVVPLSLLGTFGVMYFLGFSLNNLSLMALTISTGFVVDDAIVVVENIMRHMERGEPPMQAALTGAREVGFTVLTISVSLIAVFIPLLLMGGIVGRLFREFSVSLSVAIVMSMVISLTVTPMLSSIALRSTGHADDENEYPDSRFHRFYARTLGWVIRHPVLMGIVTILVLALNVLLYIVIPKGFFPQEDTGRLIGQVQASQSISYHAMQQKFLKINQLVLKNPNVQAVGGFVGGSNSVNTALLFVTLKPLGPRKASADQVIAQLRRTLGDIPGARLFLQSAQDITVGGRQSGAQYQFTMTADEQTDLDKWVPKVVAAMHKLPMLQDINTDQQDNSMQANVAVNRDTAARLGVNFASIDQGLYDAFGQRQVSTIYKAANQYHVVMELAPEYWTDPAALKAIYVPAGAASTSGSGATGGGTTSAPSVATSARAASAAAAAASAAAAAGPGSATVTPSTAVLSSGNALVPLSAMAQFSIAKTAISINHQGTFPAVTASFNLGPGASIGQATQQVDEAVAQLRMPASIVGSFAGTAQVFQQSVASEPILIIAALLTVYIVLGMLYENLMHPLTILSTLPSAGVGALIALLVTDTELSIIALVGVILLIGIVKKNAIMMIDFAITEERQKNLKPEQAITRACLIRFRPIMMTTSAAILGAMPLVFGSGYGSEFRKPLGISIIGGLIFSQMLTLYTTPVIYLWLDRAYQRLRRHRKEASS
ncbi:efflux RND transporter permease subunit [Paraburkholderia sp. D15]|uniref:efflux RND transporter permease subunit n=1 Tax=Paraburkholderia sp. D15 TaxID=2880218 RepID=UPI00247AD104|nr:efflux RND transporter permease subunit [Paraburkholderia sp. D15]WGS48085.1 efflux RND transporter permease subunit [Paraburkholderia sp. D15]WKF55953.1 Multidrug resistance protein MdtC [Paraburkholderia busanensis]